MRQSHYDYVAELIEQNLCFRPAVGRSGTGLIVNFPEMVRVTKRVLERTTPPAEYVRKAALV
jgi:hypothetical protein